jgi:hypothetical protein
MTKFPQLGIRVPQTKDDAQAHDLALNVLQTGAERAAVEFTDPDDDWAPIWLVLTANRATVISPGPRVEKYEAVDYVARLARRWGATALGHLHSSWIVTDPEAVAIATQRHGDTEGLPRQEVVLLATYTAGHARQYTAQINRHQEAPPTLEPFELIVDTATSEIHVQGAMVTPLLNALARVG